MKRYPLTDAERQVILNKGTEAPFTGRFLLLNEPGIYCCRQCEAPLFRSDDKFDAGCGWPSFDDEIPGAVKRVPDSDGRRTEILCKSCGGHLGHVFEGELFTPKNTRHCVNAISLSFQPEAADDREVAIFGGGCFWCLHAIFEQVIGVDDVVSGYCGGDEDDANYTQVCSGQTAHIEVVRLTFNPAVISYGQLLELFFDCHDPTSLDCQGADKGYQYHSVIFCQDERQKRAAVQYVRALQQVQQLSTPILTEVRENEQFFSAEVYHQSYYQRNSQQPYCQWNIQPKLEKLKIKYADRFDWECNSG